VTATDQATDEAERVCAQALAEADRCIAGLRDGTAETSASAQPSPPGAGNAPAPARIAGSDGAPDQPPRARWHNEAERQGALREGVAAFRHEAWRLAARNLVPLAEEGNATAQL